MNNADKYSHFKKGIDYSHYTGTARQNICDYTWLLCEASTEEERNGYKKELNKWLTELGTILAELDKINFNQSNI